MLNEKIVLENYNVQKTLARGPYSTLHKGVLDAQDVVVKVWPTAHVFSEGTATGIANEIQAFQNVSHPNVLPILAIDITTQGIAVVTPFAPYGSLQDLLKQKPNKPLAVEKALTIVTQVAQALSAAHQQGIVHGNISPPNILFTSNDTVALTDFYLPRIFAAIPGYISNEKARLHRYMAPEQFTGQATAQSDQYMLGCLAYELLTGHTPFSGSARATLQHKHAAEQPVPLHGANLILPQHIEDALMRTLAKDPVARHQDMQAFLSALDISSIEQPTEPLLAVPIANIATQMGGNRLASASTVDDSSHILRSVKSTTVEWKHFGSMAGSARQKKLSRRVLLPLTLVAVFCLVFCSITALMPSLLQGQPATLPTKIVQNTSTITPTMPFTEVTSTPTLASSTPTPTKTIPAPTTAPTPVPTPTTKVVQPAPTPTPTPIPQTVPQPSPYPSPVTVKVRPVLECVIKQNSNNYIAVFGYLNEGSETITIEVGPNNTVTPSYLNGRQPTTFKKGRQYLVVFLTFGSSETITWSLTGSTATASSDSKRC